MSVMIDIDEAFIEILSKYFESGMDEIIENKEILEKTYELYRKYEPFFDIIFNFLNDKYVWFEVYSRNKPKIFIDGGDDEI